jgi:hypothetical protein
MKKRLTATLEKYQSTAVSPTLAGIAFFNATQPYAKPEHLYCTPLFRRVKVVSGTTLKGKIFWELADERGCSGYFNSYNNKQ